MRPRARHRDGGDSHIGKTRATVFRWGVFLAAALLVIDGGLALFALALGVASLLSWPRRPRERPRHMPSLRAIAIALGIVAVAAGSSVIVHRVPLSALDNPARLLLIPWCAALAWSTGLRRDVLWWGAVAGVLIAFGIACGQMAGGALRAGSDANPIVFATLVLILIAIVMFANPSPRPRGRGWSTPALFLLGGLTLAMSGSRGALAGWLLLGVFAIIRAWRQSDPADTTHRFALPLAGVILLGLLQVPQLHAPLRLADVSSNLSRYAQGDPDTPIGARLALLSLAGRVFAEHPWAGVGMERFGGEIARLPGCGGARPMGLCTLRHAHNDLAEWAVTLGLPGLLAIVAIYGVPFSMFVRIIRTHGGQRNAAAWTGVMVVAVYVVGGLTQSMFAHAATASAYGIFVGSLLGIAWREAETDMV